MYVSVEALEEVFQVVDQLGMEDVEILDVREG
jgi:hypothetical protein